MDSFLSYFKNNVKLSDKIITMITNIILNDNITNKKENFKKFLFLKNEKIENNEKEKITILLFFTLCFRYSQRI